VEQIVSEQGATPATIAVLDGQLCVGLNQQQIELVANRDDIRKLSTRDLAIAVARVGMARPRWPLRSGLHIEPASESLPLAASVACIAAHYPTFRRLAGACTHADDRRLLGSQDRP